MIGINIAHKKRNEEGIKGGIDVHDETYFVNCYI